jgi:hypothetical protein
MSSKTFQQGGFLKFVIVDARNHFANGFDGHGILHKTITRLIN